MKNVKENQVSLPVRVPEGLLSQLRAHCEENDLSLSSVVKLALHQYLDRVKGVRPIDGEIMQRQRPSEFVEAVGHMETAAKAIAALGKLVKK